MLVLLLCSFSVAALAQIPEPFAVLGFRVGEDRKLADWNQVLDYFGRVAKADTARVRFEELGKSTLGKPFVLLTVSSAENMRNLERYRRIQARLADPRGLSEAEAQKLIADGKTVVLITCTIHSTEVASTQAALEFVHKLLTQDTPRHRTILNNTIFLLVPSLNPDGQDMVVQWYRKTVGTPSEGTSPPFLYHHYTGHDNNRDWYMFTQVETRLTVEKVHNAWHPHVVYDVHQMGPNAARIFTPPWMDPVEPNIDPLIVSEVNMLGTAMAADLATAGKKGVVVNAMYDYWTPARHYQSYHGGLRILTESASVRIASPVEVRFEQLDTNALGYNAQRAAWNYPDPWPGGTWRLRDIVDYQLITMEACLFHTAQNREMFLRNFLQIGRNALAPRPKGPFAFLVPPGQKDPGSAARMLNVLRFGMVEVHRAAKAFSAGGREYAAGTYVIPVQQPYGPFAKTMLERQNYPDLRLYPGGPPKRPYDVTAHTLPLLMNVNTVEVRQPFQAEMEKLTADVELPTPTASGVLSAAANDSYAAVNRLLKAGGRASRDAQGNFLVGAEAGRAGSRPVRAPRVGVYKSYVPSMDEGWTRYVLDKFDFAYTSVFDKDIRAGKLNDRFDVLVIAEMAPRTIVEGHRLSGERAAAPTSAPAEPGSFGGSRVSAPMPAEYSGGIGEEGVQALKDFANDGGTIVLLNRASAFGIERLGVPAKDVLASAATRDFYAPGSLLNARFDVTHPLAWGMDPEQAIWFERGPAFEVTGTATAVATFPESNTLLSGWLLGDKLLHRRAAVVDAPIGRGRIILFGMRPQYRAQSHGTYKLLFNALYYSIHR